MRRKHNASGFLVILMFMIVIALRSVGQSAPDHEELASMPQNAIGTWNILADDPGNRETSEMNPLNLITRFAGDQRAIWSSPLHLRSADAVWALPALAGTGALIASDSWLTRQLPAGEVARSRSFSNYGAYSLIGATGGMFLVGKMTHNDHAAETGFLAGEAAVNAAVADYALKSMFQRERPYQSAGAGHFFAGGASFPSEHAAVSWAIAGVVAHEYPGPLTQFFSYGVASAVTAARVTGKEHFASDAIVGAALGYFIAQQTYRRHRDPEVGEAAWGNPLKRYAEDNAKARNPRHMGSPYVPLDSWVYPALVRLAALGYVQTAYLGMRPWSRMECARLVEEAEEGMHYDGAENPDATNLPAHLLNDLASEFQEESARLDGAANLGLELDAMYTRFTGISGKPLRDGYHFAQTLVNDYGRPYGEGFNQISGIDASGVAGGFSISFRGEYQHAPAVASDSPAVLQTIAVEDGVAMPLPDGSAPVDRFRLIEGSIAFTYNNVKISFGKQNLWLGPGESGPLLMSNNAAPLTMLQIDNISPIELPLLSHLLGPARMTSFLGQLSGQNWVYSPPPAEGLNSDVLPQYLVGPSFAPQPFLHGNKISFHPTPNLEFGMGVTAIFGGPGLPFTWSEFFKSYYGHNANTAINPAKRFSSFDFTYRVPGARSWMTVYLDSLVGDEVSPIGSTRPMLNPGIYFPRLPKLQKFELRAEGFKADPRLGTIYIDRRYHSGYTNDGNLMGSWIGRQALGGAAWLKYWFSPRNSLQLGYRHQEVDRYLAGGGRLNDFSLSGQYRLGASAAVSARAQYETWGFLALRPEPKSDFSTSVQLTLYPGLRWPRN